MEFSNKTVLIVGLVCGGLLSLYVGQHDLACTIFGGLIGYLSKDTITLKKEGVIDIPPEEEDGA